MKKVVLFTVFVILLAGFVSATTSTTPAVDVDCEWLDTGCPADRPNYIFYLNQLNNAHAYTTGPMTGPNSLENVLCCKNVEKGTSCNEDNTIVWLNQNDNAHASVNKGGLYQTGVCLEGAICANSGNVEDFMVGLSQSSNAHLYSEKGTAVGTSRYCKLSGEAAASAEVQAEQEALNAQGLGEICGLNLIDDDGDGFMDCSDDECYDQIECLNQPCSKTPDTSNEMSVTNTMVVWSYVSTELNKMDANQAPLRVGCLEENQCLRNNNAVKNYDEVNKNGGKEVCSSDGNWLGCKASNLNNNPLVRIADELSDGGNYYCTGEKWIPVETNCSDGIDNGGITAYASNGGVFNFIDCQDPTCKGKQGSNGICEPKKELTCHDGFDNDGDADGSLQGVNYPVAKTQEELEAEAAKKEKLKKYKEETKAVDILEFIEEGIDPSDFERKFDGCSTSECFNAPIEVKGINKAVYLKGTENSYVKLSKKALNNKEDFSIAMWVNTKDQKKSAILSAANSQGNNGDNEFIIFNPKKLTIFLKGKKTITNFDLTKGSQWKHLVITRHLKSVKVYIDGNFKQQLTQYDDGSKLNVEQLILGQEQDVNNNGDFTFNSNQAYEGYIDELKIYNRVLDPDEIKNLSVAEGADLTLQAIQQALAGNALALPGQEREPSFLRKAWNKVKTIFNRDEAIAGQVINTGNLGNLNKGISGSQATQTASSIKNNQIAKSSTNQAQNNPSIAGLGKVGNPSINLGNTNLGKNQLDGINPNMIQSNVGNTFSQEAIDYVVNTPGTDCFDSDCKGVQGPANHTCCFNINDCESGNVCSGNQCHEIVCSDNTDNDGDNLIDCADNDCDRLPCGENSKCFNSQCVKKAEAGYATGEEIKPTFTIFLVCSLSFSSSAKYFSYKSSEYFFLARLPL